MSRDEGRRVRKGGCTRKKGRVSNSRGEVEQEEGGRERRVRKGRCKQQRLNRGREENTLKQFHTRELHVFLLKKFDQGRIVTVVRDHKTDNKTKQLTSLNWTLPCVEKRRLRSQSPTKHTVKA